MFFDKTLKQIDFDIISWGDNYGSFDDKAKHSQLVYYLKKFDISKKICIVNHAQFDETCINTSNIEFLLINCSDHPYSLPTYKIHKPSLVIDSDFNKSNYWPFHLLFSAYLATADIVDLDLPRRYSISCINRSPRISRILFRMLCKNLITEKFKYTWYKGSDSNGPVPTADDIVNQLGLDFYNQYKEIDSEAAEYQPQPEYDLCSSIADFTDSYLNLVTESRLENIGFLTEKTYKPIRAGQLFLIQGPVGAVEYLRSIGFDTFDDYIDHSYDDIPDWKQRTEQVVIELKRISENIEKIFKATIHRRIQNIRLLKSFDNQNRWTQQIVDKINGVF